MRSTLWVLAPIALVLCGAGGDEALAQQSVSCDVITGGGTIAVSGGSAGFGFEAGVRKGAYWGGVNYRDQPLNLTVESVSITRYYAAGLSTRVIEGMASTNLYGNRSYRVTAYDGRNDGAADTFRIDLDNGYSRQGPLSNGDVKLRKGNRNSTPPAGTVCTAAVDTNPPTVAITSPAPSSTVSSTVPVSASASDDVAVAGVQFYVDGAALGAEDTTAPYSVAWNTTTTTNGSHTLTAVARDTSGNTATSSPVTVTVSNAAPPPPDTTPPSVAITSPISGSTVSATTTVTANASDNVAVAGVQFKLDGAALGAEDTASPYSVSWDTKTAANGSHTLTAVARDTSGNLTTSAPVTVTVSNAAAAGGDLFVALVSGDVQWRAPDGTLRQVLTTGSDGQASSVAFDSTRNLYVPHWFSPVAGAAGNTVMRLPVAGTGYGSPSSFGTGYNCNPSSVAFDAAGNAYVGQADCTGDVLKFDPSGILVATYDVPVTSRGTDHISLAADGCTMFYTSRDKNVYRYNVCTRTVLPIFNALPLPGSNAYHLVVLPNGEVLVADSEMIVHLDASGNLVKTYDVPGQTGNLYGGVDYVGDGTFWASNGYNGNVYRFDIATGAVVASFNTASGNFTAAGVAVRR